MIAAWAMTILAAGAFGYRVDDGWSVPKQDCDLFLAMAETSSGASKSQTHTFDRFAGLSSSNMGALINSFGTDIEGRFAQGMQQDALYTDIVMWGVPERRFVVGFENGPMFVIGSKGPTISGHLTVFRRDDAGYVRRMASIIGGTKTRLFTDPKQIVQTYVDAVYAQCSDVSAPTARSSKVRESLPWGPWSVLKDNPQPGSSQPPSVTRLTRRGINKLLYGPILAPRYPRDPGDWDRAKLRRKGSNRTHYPQHRPWRTLGAEKVGDQFVVIGLETSIGQKRLEVFRVDGEWIRMQSMWAIDGNWPEPELRDPAKLWRKLVAEQARGSEGAVSAPKQWRVGPRRPPNHHRPGGHDQ